MFSHFLITRFNIPIKDYINDKSGGPVRTYEWLKHRFDLFETYCLSSVKSQTIQNFKWLVFFDVATPAVFKQKIDFINKNYPNFHPIYVNSGDDFLCELNQNIEKQTYQCEYLITSRIDNDDAIHEQYIQTIQNSFKPGNDILINFKWGLQLDLKSGILYQSRDDSNPFISRMCKYCPENIKTVFEFGHREAGKFLPIQQITNLKAWLVIIHDMNLLNTVGGKPLLWKNHILKYFNVLNNGKHNSLLTIIRAYLRFFYIGIRAKYFGNINTNSKAIRT